jgi:hypothetical protein
LPSPWRVFASPDPRKRPYLPVVDVDRVGRRIHHGMGLGRSQPENRVQIRLGDFLRAIGLNRSAAASGGRPRPGPPSRLPTPRLGFGTQSHEALLVAAFSFAVAEGEGAEEGAEAGVGELVVALVGV